MPNQADAAAVYHADMLFQSGASFSGDITFADDYSFVTGVDGILSGYTYSSTEYAGDGTDHINWIWYPGVNFSESSSAFGTFLMDGTPPADFTVEPDYYSYMNFIAFTYGYDDSHNLQLLSEDYGNAVNYADTMISGSLSPVPLPAALPLFGCAIIGLVGARFRNKNRKKTTA